MIAAMRWCPRIDPLHLDRSEARIESAFIFTLIPNVSALRRIIEVASKMLVPAGITNCFDPDNPSITANVALAAFKFSFALCSSMVTFSRVVRSFLAT